MKKSIPHKSMGIKVMTGAVALSMIAGSMGVVYAQDDSVEVIHYDNINHSDKFLEDEVYNVLDTEDCIDCDDYKAPMTDIKSFEDYLQNYGHGKLKGHWAEAQIQTLLSFGGISGVPYGDNYRFEANREIKTAELLSIILRVSNNAPTASGNWVDTTMDKSIELGLIPSSMRAEGKKALSREKMAMILVNAEKSIRHKDVATDFSKSKIADISKADPAYQEYIRQAYGIGLLAGTNEGYKPKDSTTRAETCAIVNRLFEYTNRVDNSKKEEKPVIPDQLYEALPDGSNVSESGMNFPAEGMKGPNGTTISRDPLTGVLGFGNGQKGGIYLGLKYNNSGYTIRVDDPTPVDLRGYDDLCYGSYEKHGDYVYWTGEWDRIDGQMVRKLEAEHPNATGKVADINGNIIQGKKGDKNVFFYYDSTEGGWYSTF